jgi:hypothetical protein
LQETNTYILELTTREGLLYPGVVKGVRLVSNGRQFIYVTPDGYLLLYDSVAKKHVLVRGLGSVAEKLSKNHKWLSKYGLFEKAMDAAARMDRTPV